MGLVLVGSGVSDLTSSVHLCDDQGAAVLFLSLSLSLSLSLFVSVSLSLRLCLSQSFSVPSGSLSRGGDVMVCV